MPGTRLTRLTVPPEPVHPDAQGAHADRPPRLLDQMRQRIRCRHYSYRTEEAYVGWVRRFVLFNGRRHPRELGAAEVEAFLAHLAIERDAAASTHQQALSALLFLYREVLGAELPFALERKYPQAGSAWGWFWVFPGAQRSRDPRSGIVRRHHVHEDSLQRAVKRAVTAADAVW